MNLSGVFVVGHYGIRVRNRLGSMGELIAIATHLGATIHDMQSG